MTHQLHSREITLFRNLKKTAIVLMVLFRLDKPVGEGELAEILDVYPTTIRTYLRSLARLGMVTRTHRYHGWVLTAGGRQMVLGESTHRCLEEHVSGETASVKNSRSSVKNSPSMVENPPSLPANISKDVASVKNSRSSVKNSSSMVENPPSLPAAAASLSLSFKEEKKLAAAAGAQASVKNSRSRVKISRSRFGRRAPKIKKENGSAVGGARCNTLVQANLEAFASIGLVQNDFVSRICQMDHVTPAYILGQRNRLEAERRYSAGLLLKVIQCKDSLPEKYNTCDSSPPLSRGAGGDSSSPLPRGAATETVAQRDSSPPLSSGAASSPPLSRGAGGDSPPDPSIHDPLSSSGITAAKAWSDVLRELQRDMPRAAYDKWVRDAVLLSARDGTFVIGAQSAYARDWLESRLTSTITRLLAGSCNRSVEVKFVNINAPSC